MRYFTSDLDLDLDNGAAATRRGFTSTARMRDEIVDRFNAVVTPSDSLWVLGGLTMRATPETLAAISRLAGEKHVIISQRDRAWYARGAERTAAIARLDDAGFIVYDAVWLRSTIDGLPVLLAPHSYVAETTSDPDNLWRPLDRGLPLIHGRPGALHPRQVNVSADAHDLRPVPEGTIRSCL